MKIRKLSYTPVQGVDVHTIIVEETDLWHQIQRVIHDKNLHFKIEDRTCVLISLPGQEFASGYVVADLTEQDFALLMVQALEILQKQRRGDLPIKD